MTDRRTTTVELIVVIGFCAFLFFYNLGAFGLVGADEPRYAQIAREMMDHHQYITPVLYGQPWLEKPILYYWRAAVLYHVFGVNDVAARLPSATLALLLIVITYFWTRRFRPGVQLDAALMVAASAMMIAYGRAASMDMSLAAPFSAGMLCWWGWHKAGQRWWVIAFYVFMALGTLAKGPVAPFLAGLIVAVYAVVRRDWKIVWRTLWIPGVAVYLLVTLPWFILVQLQTPSFFRTFFLEHNLERFGTGRYHHPAPIWFFIPVLLLAVMPWTTYVVAAIFDVIRDWRFRRKNQQELGDGLSLFLLIWILVPVVFFSFSQSKLPGYILPAVPPALILAAEYLHRRMEERDRPNYALLGIHAALSAILIAVLLVAPAQLLKLPPTPQALMMASAIGIAIFFGIMLAVVARGGAILRFVTLIPVILGVTFILKTVAPVIDATQSERSVAQALSSGGVPAGMTIATFKAKREVEYGVAWYRNQPVKVYERLEIPAGEHVVITRAGSEAEIQEILPGREIKKIGEFPAQRLEFFQVGK
jgi:4-amino-4-deoxy-L-arabinose transferase-like glycosyltransferase